MPWTATRTWTAGEIVTAAQVNQYLRDNLDFLKDHGNLDGRTDDDHSIYHNDARGDVRYYTQAQVDTLLGGASVNAADVKEASYSNTSATDDTWYTVLSLSGTAGYLDEIIASAIQSTAGVGEHRGYRTYARVNIDNRGTQDFNGNSLGSMENLNSVFLLYDPTGVDSYSAIRLIFGGARFATNLTVSVAASELNGSPGGGSIYGIAHYREE